MLDLFLITSVHIRFLLAVMIVVLAVAGLSSMIFLVHSLENLGRLVPLLILLGDISGTVFTTKVICNKVAPELDIRHLLILPILILLERFHSLEYISRTLGVRE